MDDALRPAQLGDEDAAFHGGAAVARHGADVMRADADRVVAIGDRRADPSGRQTDRVADQDLAAMLADRRRVDRRVGEDLAP